MKHAVIGAVALFALITPTLSAQDGTYVWPGAQEIGWYRTTVWPENPTGARPPLYRYFTQMTPIAGTPVKSATFSFDVGAWINRGVPYDAKVTPLSESRWFKRPSGAISYILTHLKRGEMSRLDYVAIKGLALWKLSNGADGKPYMRRKADVDKVRVIDDNRLNTIANRLVRYSWVKTVVRNGDRARLYTYARRGTGYVWLRLDASHSRTRESRCRRLRGVRVMFEVLGNGSFSRTRKLRTRTMHTSSWGWTGLRIYGADSRTSVRATSVGVWGEVVSPRGETTFQKQIVDGPMFGKEVQLSLTGSFKRRWRVVTGVARPVPTVQATDD